VGPGSEARAGVERLLERAEGVLAKLERILGALAPVRPDRATGSPSGVETDFDALAYRYRAGSLERIDTPDLFPLDGLIGVEEPIAQLRANARAFCAGKPYLDVLLYGERGTGKSSALRGLLREFQEQGLRLIELESQDLVRMSDLFGLLRGRPQKFVLICDDLSFEDHDPAVRRLKAVLDGGVEQRPANVMIAVTSNRRRLVPERASDNRDSFRDEAGELHLSERIHEKLSLSDRFGLALAFWGFDQRTYLEIVRHHAVALGLDETHEAIEIEAFALRFALQQGGRSGRTAKQACIALSQQAPG